MIKIIKGVYGYLDEHGTVKPKTEKDEPFVLSPEKEARLVGLGVAEYVNTPTSENEAENGQEEAEDVGRLDPEQLEELTNAQLKEMAQEMGIDTKKLTTKAKLIEAITAVDVIPGPETEAEDDDETPPSFDPAEAVE